MFLPGGRMMISVVVQCAACVGSGRITGLTRFLDAKTVMCETCLGRGTIKVLRRGEEQMPDLNLSAHLGHHYGPVHPDIMPYTPVEKGSK